MTTGAINGRRDFRRGLLFSSALTSVMLAAASAAWADDLTVPNGTTLTDPVFTSSAANSSPGSVTLSVGSAITLDNTDTDPAITIDSGSASITNGGTITAAFADQNGIAVTTNTTGGIVNTGVIKTGTTQVTDSTGAITTVGVGADEAILVEADLGTGINNSGSISTIASATNPYAILIQGGIAPVTVSSVDPGDADLDYGIVNTNSIFAIGYVAGNDSVGIGIGGGLSATVVNGINNKGGTIQATSAESNATGLYIGSLGTLSNAATSGLYNTGKINAFVTADTAVGTVATAIHIDNGGTLDEIDNQSAGIIQATTSGTNGGNAVGVDIEATGSLASIKNAGTISAVTSAAGTEARAIRDASGTLATIENSGSIIGVGSDTGLGIALELTSALANTVVTNTGTITGDIVLGGGTYQFDSSAKTITSDISVDGGTATFNLTGTAVLTAGSTLTSGGLLHINAGSGTQVNATADNLNVSTITFDGGSTYAVSYDTQTATPSGHIVADTATLHDGAVIDVTLTSYLGAATPTITVVETGTALNFDTPADPSNLVIGGIGAGYNAVLATANAGADLTITLSRKTAAQLGLNENATQIYNASVDGLEADTTFGAAVGNLATVGAVVGLYDQLLPDLTSAREYQAIRMQDLSAGFINDRLSMMRTAEQGGGDGGGRYHERYRRAGMWLQESVSQEKGDASSGTQALDGTLYALAIGYDTRDKTGDVWGGSLTYAAMNYSAGTSMNDNLAQSTMANVYYSLNRKGFFWDSIGSLAWNAYKSKRVVVAGSVSRTAEADWNGYQAGLSSQVGFSAVMGPISFRPSVGLSYAFLDQDSYTEDGGGAGVDLNIDSSTFQTLRANAELRVSGIFSKEPQLMPYVRGGISQELMDTDPEVNGSFASSGSTFALKSNKLDDSVPFVGAGLSMVGGYSRLTVEYTGQLGSKYTSHQGVVTASLMF